VLDTQTRYLPHFERLSVLAATLFLAYALTQFVDIPGWELELQLPGILLAVNFNIRTVVAFLAAGLAASGTDWLLRDHPALKDKSTLQHCLLPALTALVIGFPLYQIPFGGVWWIIFTLGGLLLTLVLIAEYIVVDPEDVRYTLAAVGLTAVSFALFLMLVIVLRSAGTRLFLVLPAVGLAAGLVSLRTLNLRLHGQWKYVECLVVAFVVLQAAAGLHYWPLSPIAFGLAVLGPAYALTSLIGGLAEEEPFPRVFYEPLAVLILVWGAALWVG
jgi:hypothetical protein